MDYAILLSIIPLIILVGIVLAALAIRYDASPKGIIAIIIPLVLFVTVLVPIVGAYEGDSVLLSYDDYLETDAVSASGSVEIVTIAGVNYLHAKDLGVGSSTLPNGEVTEYRVKKATLDVFLLMGQSNAANYRYDASIAAPIPKMGTSYYYGTPINLMYWGSANPNNPNYDTTFASYDMYDMVNGSTAKVGNVDLPFAGEYTNQLEGHKIYVVNAAIPSASINIFQPGGIAYNYCQKVFEHAMDCIDYAHYTVSVKGFIWIQGEQDHSMNVDEYKEKFLTFYDSLSWKGTPRFSNYEVPICLISKVRVSDEAGTASGVNAINSSIAQKQLAEEYPGIYMATEISDTFTVANGLMLPDNGHYSQTGDNAIGVAVAEYYVAHVLN